jgi:hypothetical protein
VKDILADMETTGEIPPEPLAEKQYSGKFQVRITPALHRKLAIEAAEEKVSLNRYISYKLGWLLINEIYFGEGLKPLFSDKRKWLCFLYHGIIFFESEAQKIKSKFNPPQN